MTLDAFMSWQEIRLRRQLGTALPRGGAFQPPRVVADPMPLPRTTTTDRGAKDTTAAILRGLGAPAAVRRKVQYDACRCGRPKTKRSAHCLRCTRTVIAHTLRQAYQRRKAGQ